MSTVAHENSLSALADVAATLFISLPDSPQGKPFIDRAEAASPAALLRAMRKRLNLTQREFGILLAPQGGSAISPSVVCQLESALQSVPPALVSRAVAATTACQKLGEYLCGLQTSKDTDAAGALKALGPGCIDELQPYLNANPNLSADDQHLVREFLGIVTKRRHSTGGSRPGARGPYRKLAKVSDKKSLPEQAGAAAPAAAATSSGSSSPSGVTAASAATALVHAAATHPGTPIMGAPAHHMLPIASAEMAADAPACACNSSRSTPCSTPGSSRGSSRPRSPTSLTGYESESKSPRVARSASNASILSDVSIASSPAFTPGGTVVGLGTPTPGSTPGTTPGGSIAGLVGQNGEVSLEVLLALRRLQEENEALQRENQRLRTAGAPPTPPVASSEIARGDVTMSC